MHKNIPMFIIFYYLLTISPFINGAAGYSALEERETVLYNKHGRILGKHYVQIESGGRALHRIYDDNLKLYDMFPQKLSQHQPTPAWIDPTYHSTIESLARTIKELTSYGHEIYFTCDDIDSLSILVKRNPHPLEDFSIDQEYLALKKEINTEKIIDGQKYDDIELIDVDEDNFIIKEIKETKKRKRMVWPQLKQEVKRKKSLGSVNQI